MSGAVNNQDLMSRIESLNKRISINNQNRERHIGSLQSLESQFSTSASDFQKKFGIKVTLENVDQLFQQEMQKVEAEVSEKEKIITSIENGTYVPSKTAELPKEVMQVLDQTEDKESEEQDEVVEEDSEESEEQAVVEEPVVTDQIAQPVAQQSAPVITEGNSDVETPKQASIPFNIIQQALNNNPQKVSDNTPAFEIEEMVGSGEPADEEDGEEIEVTFDIDPKIPLEIADDIEKPTPPNSGDKLGEIKAVAFNFSGIEIDGVDI